MSTGSRTPVCSDDVEHALPCRRERVSDVGRCAARRESARAGNPELRFGIDAGLVEDLVHILVDRLRVLRVRVDAGLIPAVAEHDPRPRPIVVAHRLRDDVHVLDVEKHDRALGESLALGRGDRVASVDRALYRVDV
jgi:hypothetical protein